MNCTIMICTKFNGESAIFPMIILPLKMLISLSQCIGVGEGTYYREVVEVSPTLMPNTLT